MMEIGETMKEHWMVGRTARAVARVVMVTIAGTLLFMAVFDVSW